MFISDRSQGRFLFGSQFAAGMFIAVAMPFASAADNAVKNADEQLPIYSSPVREGNTNLYWGDTHLHTRDSADAYTMLTHLSREDAFRFARGEKVKADNGMPVRLRRPLDFLAITDHAEYLGIFSQLADNNANLKGWKLGEEWRDLLQKGMNKELTLSWSIAIQGSDEKYKVPLDLQKSIWSESAEVADRYNEPGLFTAFIGYEWTSMISGDNLHRVVIFKDDAKLASQVLPFSAQHSTDPVDLWNALADYETKTGGEVLAIAHNGNVSNGRMFAPTGVDGKLIDSAYAEKRARWEPVYEATQIKGDGEAHPYLSPDDEFADYETWDQGNITLTTPKKPEMLQYEYVRSGLKEGLRHEANLGTNPFKFGLVGSTDSHTGLSTPYEDNFFGKFGDDEPSADRTNKLMAGQLQEVWKLVASGLAAVWAEENTRSSLFSAIKRREVYATTGTRITLRFFGGWSFTNEDLLSSDFDRIGYIKGVPMGGDLFGKEVKRAPTFMVAAARDPLGANLDRVQVVKGWLDDKGLTHEKVYDVALSDGRKLDKRSGKAPAVGNTVNIKDASYSNSLGDAELATVWTDPDFNSSQKAFYYVRVLEIPTPRWTAYDAKYLGADITNDAPMVVQERAYSSPIWYTP
jgi:hypothetical protein